MLDPEHFTGPNVKCNSIPRFKATSATYFLVPPANQFLAVSWRRNIRTFRPFNGPGSPIFLNFLLI